MVAQSNILSQLGVKSKGTVYMSVTPGVGLEMIQLDNTTKTVAAYACRPLDYNETLRELADYNQFKEAAQELFEELHIIPKSNVVLNMPMVSFGIAERPLILSDDAVKESLISDVEQSYVFKRHEPVVAWTDSNSSVSNDMRKILYTAIQKSVIDNISAALTEIGATLQGMEMSLTSLLKALDYSGVTETQMKDGITWNLMLIGSSGYYIISMVGKNIVDFYEEPLAIKTFEGDEIYNAICSSANITLMSYPANYLYIVSETNMVSAELIAKKINTESTVDYLDNNQFKKQELIPASLSVLPDYVLKISANSIGIAAPRTRNYPVKFDFIQKQAVTGGDDNEPVKISIGENEFEISPTSALKISGIACAILVVPVLLLMMLLPKTAQNSSAKVQEINKQIASIDDEIKKFSDSNKSNQFNEQDSIKTTLENNKTKLMSYSALGASVPKTLWITYFSAQNNGLIDIQGEAESVEDVYAFFRNMKDSLLNSNLRLHKLQLISDNVDELVEDGMLSEGYEFEITNMSEEELGMTEEVPQEEKDNNNKNTKNVSKKSTPPKELPKQKSSKRSGNYAKEVTGK